jgi:YfiH family protein
LLVPDWPVPDAVVAFSTTRISGDTARPALLAGYPEPRITQVHGKRVVDAASVSGSVEADGITSAVPGTVCRVVTADCLPVLFCNTAGTEIAAVHAGWRGLAAGILEQAVAAMASSPDRLLAWIGPAISQANYEVGAELLEAFLHTAPGQEAAVRRCFQPSGEKYRADLVALARLRLSTCGVDAVYGGGFCTFADSDRFHSFRRDGEAAGRLVTGLCILR